MQHCPKAVQSCGDWGLGLREWLLSQLSAPHKLQVKSKVCKLVTELSELSSEPRLPTPVCSGDQLWLMPAHPHPRTAWLLSGASGCCIIVYFAVENVMFSHLGAHSPGFIVSLVPSAL